MKAEKLIINGEEQELFDWDYSNLENKPTLGTAASKDVGTSAGEVPILDANGKLDSSIVPSTGVMTSYTVTNKSDLTTLTTAVKGDIGIVTSENKTYILSNDPYSTLSNWTELLFPTGSVSSVNGFTGAVNLTTGYIQESNNNLFVSSTEKATWNNKLGANNVSTVALTGNYGDLNNKPVIDTALNNSSTNAVQNKAIATAVNNISSSITSMQGDIENLQTETGGIVSDTAFGPSWDGDTTHAPSKNAIFDFEKTQTDAILNVNNSVTTLRGDMNTALAGKQDTLVSGTNIKTINNESLLGSGNIDISSIILEGGSTGTFIRAAKQSGTKHTINMGTNNTYTFQGFGRVLVKGYYGWACEINDLQMFYYDFDSGVYTYYRPCMLITMGPGDKVKLWRPGSSGSWDGEVADFY